MMFEPLRLYVMDGGGLASTLKLWWWKLCSIRGEGFGVSEQLVTGTV